MLIAVDFDGTLAELADDPDAVWLPDARAALLTGLAACPGVLVAVVSGRALDDLRRRTPGPPVVRIGSHGAERDGTAALVLEEDERSRLRDLDARASAAAAGVTGSFVERKPASVVFHHRRSPAGAADPAVAELLGLAEHPGVLVRRGHDSVELAVRHTRKSDAVVDLRDHWRPDAVLALGDDVTDEDVFAVLGPDDLAVRVGSGPTSAARRVPGPADAAALLRQVLAWRRGG